MKAALFSLVSLFSAVLAHPERQLSAREIERREIETRERHIKARNCEAQIRAFNEERVAKRHAKIAKRATGTAQAPAAHVTGIPDNATCITAPEVTEGPYYINNEIVRNDLTETQTGVDLILDVGVLDINTCEPVSNAFVELWAANATGVYGGYSGASNAIKTETFLRGGAATDSQGIVEITTIYPGFYTGRTAHIHAMVHLDWDSNTDGTVDSHSGSLVHIGQFFFDETWNDAVYATSPYTSNRNRRTLNSQDGILSQANSGGYNSFASLSYVNGQSLASGLYGYITVGVDSDAAYTISNRNSYGTTD